MKRLIAVLALAPALTATGCAATGSSSPVAAAARTPVDSPTATSVRTPPCDTSNATPVAAPGPNDGPRLPASFATVAGYLCSEQQRAYKGDGVWVVLVAQRLVGDLEPLREALLLPDTA